MSRRQTPVYRDGKVHVMADHCPTCIYGPNSPVSTERVRGMLDYCVRDNRITPCHEWMDTKTPAICHGLYATGRVGMLQIAERMGAIVLDEMGAGPGFEVPS